MSAARTNAGALDSPNVLPVEWAEVGDPETRASTAANKATPKTRSRREKDEPTRLTFFFIFLIL